MRADTTGRFLTCFALSSFQYAVWYRDEEGLHTAADLVSLVFKRSTDISGFPGLFDVEDYIDPLMTSCRAMQEVLSVSPKFFVEDSKMATLFGKSVFCAHPRSSFFGSDLTSLFGKKKCGRLVMSGGKSNAHWTRKHDSYLGMGYARFLLCLLRKLASRVLRIFSYFHRMNSKNRHNRWMGPEMMTHAMKSW